MRTKTRIHIKQEKIIVGLLYKKGLISKSISQLYWAEYSRAFRPKKSKEGIRFTRYLPEIFYCQADYWGEYDEIGIVADTCDRLKYRRKYLIRKLRKMPTKIHDNKIRKVLLRKME